MIDNEETIKKIKSFGLNTYEAKIWTASLSRGVSTAGELSDIADVPRSRSYDVLESLEKKGFVVMKLGKPIKYLAVPPKDVLGNIKKRIKHDGEAHLSKIKHQSFISLINSFQELYEKNTSATDNFIAVLKGRKNIYRHLVFLLKAAKKDVSFSLEDPLSEYSKIADDLKNTAKIVVKSKNAGIRVCSIDEEDALIFPVQENEVHPDYDMCLWIKDNSTAKFLKQLLASV